MTEPAPAPAKAAPAPAPAPAPAAAPATGPLSAAEQQQLSTLLARQAAAAGDGPPVRMKIEGSHSAFSYGGLTVGTEFTTVPASLAGAFIEAAADAGVQITQES